MAIIITGGKLTRTIGEPVDLKVEVTNKSAVLTDFQWDIKGMYVKDYEGPDASFRKGKKHDLEEADKKARDIKFYWINEGSHEVKVKYKMDGADQEDKATFDVKSPKVKSFESTTGTKADSWIIVGDRMGFKGPLAKPANERGITWTAVVERNGAAIGKIAYIQLIAKLQKWTPGVTITTAGDYVLDGAAGKTKIFYWGRTVPLSGADATIKMNDQPSEPLDYMSPDALTVESSRDFKLWLMYQSDEPKSIYVPLGSLLWHCKGKAKRATKADPWALDGVGDIAESPKGTFPVHDFPEWTKYAPDVNVAPAGP